MDGNGRWAANKGLSRSEGHRAGVDVVKTIVKASLENKIKFLSIWAFGQDNWSRPIAEVDFLMQLFIQSLEQEIDELNQNGVKLRFTGDRNRLSQPLQAGMQLAESMTMHNRVLTLNVVINYGGKWDIVQATKQIAAQVATGKLTIEDIDENLFSVFLQTHDLPDPDLFIRTSGEQRISNFLLWQLAYTEMYFSAVCWPDFTIDEFNKALDNFANRERRFGRTSEQVKEGCHV